MNSCWDVSKIILKISREKNVSESIIIKDLELLTNDTNANILWCFKIQILSDPTMCTDVNPIRDISKYFFLLLFFFIIDRFELSNKLLKAYWKLSVPRMQAPLWWNLFIECR